MLEVGEPVVRPAHDGAVTTSLFFAVYGVGLLFCAWQLTRGQSWARSPVVLAQLIQLGVAWSFRGGDTTWVAIALAVVAVVVLAGFLHPRASTPCRRAPAIVLTPRHDRAYPLDTRSSGDASG